VAAKLGKDVFLALVAVAWSDGDVTTAEARAIVRAASASGLADADLDEIEQATQDPLSLDAIPPASMTPDGCRQIYALACYLAAADGRVVDAERAALTRVADRFGLSEDDRKKGLEESVTIAESMNAGAAVIEALAREVRRSK
jgi:uncharacterized membrane protein YebE (DUF533 family)